MRLAAAILGKEAVFLRPSGKLFKAHAFRFGNGAGYLQAYQQLVFIRPAAAKNGPVFTACNIYPIHDSNI